MPVCYLTIKDFLLIPQDDWIIKMTQSLHDKDDGTIPTPELYSSWRDCHTNLTNELKLLPKEFQELSIIFEYQVPAVEERFARHDYRWRRADVIILDKDTAYILEFKSTSYVDGENYDDHIRQLHHYYKMISQSHNIGRNQTIYSGLIFTGNHDSMEDIITHRYLDRIGDVYTISNTHNAIACIVDYFENPNPMNYEELTEWIDNNNFHNTTYNEILDTENSNATIASIYELLEQLNNQTEGFDNSLDRIFTVIDSLIARIESLEETQTELENRISELENNMEITTDEALPELPEGPISLSELFTMIAEYTNFIVTVHAEQWTEDYCFVPLEQLPRSVRGYTFINGEYHNTRCLPNDTIITVQDNDFIEEIEAYVRNNPV